MKTKQTKAQRIAELERQLHEAKAAQVHNYHFASKGLDKLGTDRLMGSGVILSMTVLGGRTTFDPVLILVDKLNPGSSALSPRSSRSASVTALTGTRTTGC
jgi:hypothetical protein